MSNAGGLDPAGCATAVREVAERLGLTATVVAVEGDDLLPARLDRGVDLVNLDTGERFADVGLPALTANAYLGGFGITAALDAGADVVVTGRVTDAALVVGPAAWWHGWTRDATWTRWPAPSWPATSSSAARRRRAATTRSSPRSRAWSTSGFPIAEVAADGSSVITKHAGTGGLVSVGTVTAQLLYEIGRARPTPTPTSPPGSTRSRSSRSARTGCGCPAWWASRRRRR